MVSHDIEKGGKHYTKTEPFTTGLNFLPCDGSIIDQPQRIMTFFAEFMFGERRSFGT